MKNLDSDQIRVIVDRVWVKGTNPQGSKCLELNPHEKYVLFKNFFRSHALSSMDFKTFLQSILDIGRISISGAVRRLIPNSGLRLTLSDFFAVHISQINISTNIGLMKFVEPFNGITFDEIVLRNQYNAMDMSGMTVVDAGANTGIFAIFAAKCGASKVLAFEPIPETADILEKNVILNGLEDTVEVIRGALGEKNGQVKLYLSETVGDQGASIVMPKGRSKEVSVPIFSLDSLMGKDPINFLKIDTEGYEAEVLLGGKRIIRRDRPYLSFSVYHKPNDEIELAKVVSSIEPNYDFQIIDRGELDMFCQFKSEKGD